MCCCCCCCCSECTLFVGNLSFDCDEDSLNEFFSNGGFEPVSVRILSSNGRSKGSVLCLTIDPSSCLSMQVWLC